jgi:pyridoxal phosphate enzyme (YggS family)
VTDITEHLAEIVERVARASGGAGRSPDSVTIVAVSKQQPAEAIAKAHAAGLRHFGESYVQEALPKLTTLESLPLVWHFIGRIQANKTRAIAEKFEWVHTVDRLKLAERLSEQRPIAAAPLNVLIQANLGGEEQKAGVPRDEVAKLAREVAQLPRLRLRGLMTLPPRDAAPQRWFAELALLQRRLIESGLPLDSLSMGMSADFEAAIAAGATHIRVGTALFGART